MRKIVAKTKIVKYSNRLGNKNRELRLFFDDGTVMSENEFLSTILFEIDPLNYPVEITFRFKDVKK